MSSPMKIPELLSPAGNLEKLKVAVLYGADAVYFSGQKFGLRAASDNFTEEELKEGIQFAKERGVKTYITVNGFLHDKDLQELPAFALFLAEQGVDAFIVSDLGVLQTLKEVTHVPLHLSTQASCLNHYSANFWKEQGVKRVILGRETSIDEAQKIKEKTGLEVELFIHGAMCMSYSGNCVISNYTQGRDSNRGGCAHSCRFEYSFGEEQNKKNAFFMSSKDLEGIELVPHFVKAGIDSVKIEGRMKSHLYVATLTKMYREALQCGHDIQKSLEKMPLWLEEIRKLPRRSGTTASLVEKAGDDSIYNDREEIESLSGIAGHIEEVIADKYMVIHVKNKFQVGDELELLPFAGKVTSFRAEKISTLANNPLIATKPSTLIKLPYLAGASPFQILRKKKTEVSL